MKGLIITGDKGERLKLKMTPGLWIEGKTYWAQHDFGAFISEKEVSFEIKRTNLQSEICLYDIMVTNHSMEVKEVKLLMMYSDESKSNDQLAFVSPSEKVIFHHVDKKLYLINGKTNGNGMETTTVQPIWTVPAENIWSCEKKGILRYQPLAKGAVASIFSLNLILQGHETKQGSSWVIYGVDRKKLINLNNALLKTH
ncbi:hypothetical protein [Bacillus methanolicus]|uniref:Uncharacterized protein n=1 Tax=Bacillus methanolicus (strain MGA3 / ATCC 53907) TaxID=796606 RepID=I3EAH5_BACMM|nr:hypothetical protein [Bacillus methanolicus]AIE60736.1 hypothetical protein BMMGA3_11705 [Bacillus methanolicus MGA3]EIJ83496.1 hypothetical protein MGA3_09760 [Bacillus methanolicus MGA3]UQD52747.1 hypothetical protein C0971_12420 [Bacillus methanolicus]